MTEQEFIDELQQEITANNIEELKKELSIMAVKAEQFGGTEILAHWFDEMRRLLDKPNFSEKDVKTLFELKATLDNFRLKHSPNMPDEKSIARGDIINAVLSCREKEGELHKCLKYLQKLEQNYIDKYGQSSGLVPYDLMIDNEE